MSSPAPDPPQLAGSSRRDRFTRILAVQRATREYARLETWRDHARMGGIQDPDPVDRAVALALNVGVGSGLKLAVDETRERERGKNEIDGLRARLARGRRELEVCVVRAAGELERERKVLEALREKQQQQQQQRQNEKGRSERIRFSTSEAGVYMHSRRDEPDRMESENETDDQARWRLDREESKLEQNRQTRETQGLVAARRVLQEWTAVCLARCEMSLTDGSNVSGVDGVNGCEESGQVGSKGGRVDNDVRQSENEEEETRGSISNTLSSTTEGNKRGNEDYEEKQGEKREQATKQTSRVVKEIREKIDVEYDRYVALRRRLERVIAALRNEIPDPPLPVLPRLTSITGSTASQTEPLHSQSQPQLHTQPSTSNTALMDTHPHQHSHTISNRQTSTTDLLSLVLPPKIQLHHYYRDTLTPHSTYLDATMQKHHTALLATLDRLACESHLLPLNSDSNPDHDFDSETAASNQKDTNPPRRFQTRDSTGPSPPPAESQLVGGQKPLSYFSSQPQISTHAREQSIVDVNRDTGRDEVLENHLRSWVRASRLAESQLARTVNECTRLGMEAVDDAHAEMDGIESWKGKKRVIEGIIGGDG